MKIFLLIKMIKNKPQDWHSVEILFHKNHIWMASLLNRCGIPNAFLGWSSYGKPFHIDYIYAQVHQCVFCDDPALYAFVWSLKKTGEKV